MHHFHPTCQFDTKTSRPESVLVLRNGMVDGCTGRGGQTGERVELYIEGSDVTRQYSGESRCLGELLRSTFQSKFLLIFLHKSTI